MFSFACTNREKVEQVTVLSYNIHHGVGMDGKLDLQRIGKIIKKVNPDIVALQEVELKTKKTGNIDQAKVLAKATGLNYAFGPAINFAGGKYGNAILSRYPIKSIKNISIFRLSNMSCLICNKS